MASTTRCILTSREWWASMIEWVLGSTLKQKVRVFETLIFRVCVLTQFRSELGICKATSVFSVVENIYPCGESGVWVGFCILRYLFESLAGGVFGV